MGKCIAVNVSGTPNLQVISITVDNTNPKIGQPITVTATIKNNGSASGSKYFDVYVDGTALGLNKSITLNPGQQSTLSWTITVNKTGSHNICVDTMLTF